MQDAFNSNEKNACNSIEKRVSFVPLAQAKKHQTQRWLLPKNQKCIEQSSNAKNSANGNSSDHNRLTKTSSNQNNIEEDLITKENKFEQLGINFEDNTARLYSSSGN